METFLPLDALFSVLSTAFVLLAWIIVGLLFYGYVFDRTVFEGFGRVRTERFGWAEALIGLALLALFTLVIVSGFGPSAKAAPDNLPSDKTMVAAVIVNTVVFGLMIAGMLGVLMLRRISWRESFGLARLGPVAVVWRAVMLIALAFPLIAGALLLTRLMFGLSESSEPQEIVVFFAESKSTVARAAVAASALIFAPIQEEFIFRGFLYGVLRRYFGIVPGILINAALFAGIHLNTSVLGGLFVLAVCLTLAYEWTGSIFVPMAMHALFNSLTVINLLTGGQP